MFDNPLFKVDSYKVSHWEQYPPGSEFVSGYIEARGWDKSMFDVAPELPLCGVKPFLESLKQPVTKKHVAEADEFYADHGLHFNRAGWDELVKLYDGNYPIEIQALKEGTIVDPLVPMVQFRNTDPRFPWLQSWMETQAVRAVWYPTTVSTISRECKKVIYAALVKSADDPDAEIGFKLHDFGARGVSSGESAMLGGMAHLVNFFGTDTVEALVGARYFYGERMAGFSIPAAEHSTITAWGKQCEGEAYKNMIDKFMSKPGMVAVVSDSYDIYNACSDIWGGLLKDKVQMYGERGGVLVVRPDSGNPKDVVYSVINRLADAFGHTLNSKGFKVLPKYLRVIQGDGVNIHSIREILDDLMDHGWSASNVGFGMGGALLQKCDRDTFAFAMKANEIDVAGERRDVYKAPLTDSGKVSKKGRQAVIEDSITGRLVACREDALGHRKNHLELVYKNGMYFRYEKFKDIRARAALSVKEKVLEAA